MKPQPPRTPSPLLTTFSGVSTYRRNGFYGQRTGAAPPTILVDYRTVHQVHFDELNRYLAGYFAKAPPNSRTTARQKLARLTIQQFHELSTDVYDELVRRQKNSEVPFLSVKEEFHPKRNQARQKLAILLTTRFKDLSGDVHFELARRYPEFKQGPFGGRAFDGFDYSGYSAPGFPSSTSSPGLGGLATRLRKVEDDGDDGNASGHVGTKSGGEEYYGWSSWSSDLSLELGPVGRGSILDDSKWPRRPYEYNLSTLQSQITKELGEMHDVDNNQSKVQRLDHTFVSVSAQNSEEDIAQLLHTRVLSSKDSYKRLLEAKDAKAQRILDLLQNLLNSPRVVEEKARGSILMALLRLSASSGLYPQQLRLHNIERESSPVTAGQFGEIWKGEYQGRPVCLKIFKLYQRSEIEHLLKRFSREAIVWNQFAHPNLLPFYGIYHLDDTHGRVGLVSPWMGNGNLPEYLKAHPESQRLPFVHDTLAGLQYLHRHQVVHGDLKGVNILVSEDGSACLADFGLSSVMDADVLRWTSLATITKVGGTVRWMAPEMIEAAEDGLLHPTFTSDIYSLASVMFEAFTGQIPYYEFPRDITVISKVTFGIKPSRPKPEMAPELTDHVWRIMTDCWSGTPSDRPTIDQVIGRLSDHIPHPSQAQPAWVELRSPIFQTGTLTKSDMTFLMGLLDHD